LETGKYLSEKELKEVFLTYKSSLFGFIMSKTRNHHDAEDLFSKSFIKFFEYASKNPVRTESLKSFLYKIASNTTNDYFRRKKIIRFISMDDKSSSEPSNYEFFKDNSTVMEIENIDNKNLISSINGILSGLPEEQKEAFYLRFIENLSFAEIASLQGASLSTVLSRVRYAVNKIRNALEKKGELQII
jgi:RNA polymerase sigma-70 factor, ECF subfamily